MPKNGQARVPSLEEQRRLFEVIRQNRHPVIYVHVLAFHIAVLSSLDATLRVHAYGEES